MDLIYLYIKVTEVDENLLKFKALEELTLSANRIITVNSKNLPTSLKVSLSTLYIGFVSIVMFLFGFLFFWPNYTSLGRFKFSKERIICLSKFQLAL